MNNINYQKELDKIISALDPADAPKSLLLHSCCAPCSSYVLKYLSEYFAITLLYYNPNISPQSEYDTRLKEQARLIEELPVRNPVRLIEGRYEPQEFYEAVRGLEKEPEGGARCKVCYELRLREAAREAARLGCDYFATTLTISPLKDSGAINGIAQKVGQEYGVTPLPSDFKKRDGYKQSVELSKEYGLYRQNFCGCIFSKGEA